MATRGVTHDRGQPTRRAVRTRSSDLSGAAHHAARRPTHHRRASRSCASSTTPPSSTRSCSAPTPDPRSTPSSTARRLRGRHVRRTHPIWLERRRPRHRREPLRAPRRVRQAGATVDPWAPGPRAVGSGSASTMSPAAWFAARCHRQGSALRPGGAGSRLGTFVALVGPSGPTSGGSIARKLGHMIVDEGLELLTEDAGARAPGWRRGRQGRDHASARSRRSSP